MNSFIESLNQWGGNFLNFRLADALAVEPAHRGFVRVRFFIPAQIAGFHPLRAVAGRARETLPAADAGAADESGLVAAPNSAASRGQTSAAYTVTYDNAPLPELPQTSLPAFVPPKPAMNFAAWLLVSSAVSQFGLVLLALVRWWQIARQIRRAKTSERLAALAGKRKNSSA